MIIIEKFFFSFKYYKFQMLEKYMVMMEYNFQNSMRDIYILFEHKLFKQISIIKYNCKIILLENPIS